MDWVVDTWYFLCTNPNLHIVRLYQKTGWEESPWVDPQWLEDAERSRPG